MSPAGSPRRAARRLFADQAGSAALFCLVVAAGWVVFGGPGPVWVNYPFSGWETGVGLAVRAGAAYPLGRRLVRIHLPRYVTHGQTRREYWAAAGVVAIVYAVLLAAFLTAGLVAEWWLHQTRGVAYLAAWSHLYDTPAQVWLVFVEYVLIMSVWTVAGAAVAASKFESPSRSYGFLAMLAAVALVESAVGTPLPGPLGFAVSVPTVAAVVLGTGVTALGGAVIWLVLRDVAVPAGAR